MHLLICKSSFVPEPIIGTGNEIMYWNHEIYCEYCIEGNGVESGWIAVIFNGSVKYDGVVG